MGEESFRENVEAVARRLYGELERLDPSEGAGAWDEISDGEREIYRIAVTALVEDAADELRALLAQPSLHK